MTRALQVEVAGRDWRRTLDLRRSEEGEWSCSASADPEGERPPGGDPADFAEALDCDLGLCPLTNSMPILRGGFLGPAEPRDFVMAWVSVPYLEVRRSEQRYEHVAATDQGARVRYVGRHRGFVGELEVDRDGLVVLYPDLGERVFPA